MKKKKIEATEPVKADKKGQWITTQVVDDILVLNFYLDKKLYARHCINTKTSEYATLKAKDEIWYTTKIENARGYTYSGYWCLSRDIDPNKWKMSEDSKTMIKNLLKDKCRYYYEKESVLNLIERVETYYNEDMREKKETNRINRVNAMMKRVPAIPYDTKEWIDEKELGKENYCMKDRKTKLRSCSGCGGEFEEKDLSDTKPRNNDMVVCPLCNRKIRYLTRKQKIDIRAHFSMVQPIDSEVAVTRHFTAHIECIAGQKKAIGIYENIRIIMFKGENRKKDCEIYYEQYNNPKWLIDRIPYDEIFDNKSNPKNKRIYEGYMYDGGIEEAFKDTAYEKWARLFKELSDTKLKLQYNNMMASTSKKYMEMMEMLYRGRFYKLLYEESMWVYAWSGDFYGDMNLKGSSIEDVFRIYDKQKINRIRDKNGDGNMLNWMRYSDREGIKISDKFLDWANNNNICPTNLSDMLKNFTPEQAMNYIIRQKEESYKGKNNNQVISQYCDYIRMCERLGKDISDEMIYRPRQLKRRHDEAVLALKHLNAQEKADEYSKKFSESEEVLKEIKDKFEYTGEKYFIKVPERIVDIVLEGNYLHHCAGLTDRYFDRIKQHETYICFMRKLDEPDIPFYTIEVEPGGTIRQHRGMYDEEPELEAVKPFLREWQQVIRKRMKEEDKQRAERSKILREQNIKELQEKNNTRVLKGLMEDFMEAV